MRREPHVRFREGPGVKFPRATRLVQTYDVWFRPIFAFFIVDVNSKEVVHVGVTRGPNQCWTAQQLRAATPFGDGPDILMGTRFANRIGTSSFGIATTSMAGTSTVLQPEPGFGW